MLMGRSRDHVDRKIYKVPLETDVLPDASGLTKASAPD
jgi:hypothetical protein